VVCPVTQEQFWARNQNYITLGKLLELLKAVVTP
jgi:hypothetical protein